MAQVETPRPRPRIFNTPFETGLRSVVILTTTYPDALGLSRLVIFDHLIVHTEDVGGPKSMHPKDRSRAAEILVRRRLVDSGLALMQTRGLVARVVTAEGLSLPGWRRSGLVCRHARQHVHERLKRKGHLADRLHTSFVRRGPIGAGAASHGRMGAGVSEPRTGHLSRAA